MYGTMNFMKTILLLSLSLLMTLSVLGVTFRELTKGENAVLELSSPTDKVIDFHLILQNSHHLNGTLHLSLFYIIDKDTVVDYLRVDESTRGKVKSLKIKSGQRVKAFIKNRNGKVLQNIKGNFSYAEGMMEYNSSNDNVHYYTGNIWNSEEKTLFRISYEDSLKVGIQFKVVLTESFEYDSLHLKFKVISPSHGEMKFIKSEVVNEGEFLDGKEKIITFDLKGMDIYTNGKYYFEIQCPSNPKLLNGVSLIGYQLVEFN